MAIRKNKKGHRTPDEIREKIKGAMLIKKLQDNMKSDNLSASQVSTAKILLGKIIPDLKATEHSGGLTIDPLQAIADAVSQNNKSFRDERD